MTPLLDSTLVGERFAPTRRSKEERPKVLILGVGNILMGDEGVGIHVVREIETLAPQPDVRVLDGGTGGVSLLADLDGLQAIILVDATSDGRADGTIAYLRPQRIGDLPRGLGAHDFGLKDLFAASALLKQFPDLHLFTISVSTIVPMSLQLSAEVAPAVSCVAAAAYALAAQLSVTSPCGCASTNTCA